MKLADLLSIERIRALPTEKKWLGVSAIVSLALIFYAKSGTGELLNVYTDHLHHALATWVFLHLGLDAYRLPLGVSSTMVKFIPGCAAWPQFPVAYPPGMFAVFLPVSLAGAWLPITLATMGRLAVIWLTGIMHAALWVMTDLVRRVGSKAWVFVFVTMWIYLLRVPLLGFYDGAWLLAAALGIQALADQKHARAVVCFVAALLVSYRGACLAPLGVVALWGMLRSEIPISRKLGVVAFGFVGTVVSLGAFYMLMKYSPPGDEKYAGVGSSLMPMSFRPYVILAFGIGTAAYLAWAASPVVGAMVGFASGLSILHGGHVWHGCLLVPSVLSLSLVKKPSLTVQIALGTWFTYFLGAAFDYPPFRFVEELIRFAEYNGLYPH